MKKSTYILIYLLLMFLGALTAYKGETTIGTLVFLCGGAFIIDELLN